jgi:hypothetical protein
MENPKIPGMLQLFESLGVDSTSDKLMSGEWGNPSDSDNWRAKLAKEWLNDRRASEASLYIKQHAESAMRAADAAERSASIAERAADAAERSISAAERAASAAERQATWARWAAIIAVIAAIIAIKDQMLALITGS